METREDLQDLEREKQVEFYAAHVKAMLDSSVEKNRQLLTLSSLAIGVLMGLFDTEDLSGMPAFFLWISTCISFTICIIITLIYFPKNVSYLNHVIKGETLGMEEKGKHLKVISILASVIFVFSIFIMFSLVIFESKFVIHEHQEKVKAIEKINFQEVEELY